jgi:hypothetical protein
MIQISHFFVFQLQSTLCTRHRCSSAPFDHKGRHRRLIHSFAVDLPIFITNFIAHRCSTLTIGFSLRPQYLVARQPTLFSLTPVDHIGRRVARLASCYVPPTINSLLLLTSALLITSGHHRIASLGILSRTSALSTTSH